MNFSSRRVLITLLTLLGVTLLFVKLDAGGLPSWDDAYYAQKAKEIMNSGDVWTSTIAGKPLFDNPPGFFWTIAASYKAFGVSEFSARFPSALGGLLGILGTFFLFELLFSTRIGFLSALILSFTTVYLKYARHSMIDASITAAGVWCFYFFLRGLKDRPAFFLLAGLVGSYIMFAKSLFGGLPLVALLIYLILSRQLRALARWQLWAGLVIYFTPYVTWCLVEYSRFGYHFLDTHFIQLMFAMSSAKSPNDNVWDYAVVMLKYFPIFLPFFAYGLWQAFRRRDGQRSGYIFLLTYFFTYFIILSLQGTTKTWYFTPAWPACAGLAALGLDRALRRFSLESIAKVVAGLAAVLYVVVQMTPIKMGKERALEIRQIAPYVRAAAQQGFNLISFNNDYYSLNNALLFYADTDAKTVSEEELNRALTSDQKVGVVFTPSDWDRFKSSYPKLQVVRRTSELVFVSDQPVNQEQIF